MQGRAWVFTGVKEPFEPREFPLPDIEPDGILVRLTVANICGSDLHGWHGRTPRSGPTIMGHEMTGRVEKLGSHIKTDAAGAPLREGDRIVYSYFYPCRRCDPCLAHDEHHCVARRIGAGRSRSDNPPYFTGAYAEYYYLRSGHYGTIFGTLGLAAGFGAGAGPWFTGAIHDRTGSYEVAFCLAIVLSVVSMIAIRLAAPRKVRAVAGRVPRRPATGEAALSAQGPPSGRPSGAGRSIR